jgi:hypothetical protein
LGALSFLPYAALIPWIGRFFPAIFQSLCPLNRQRRGVQTAVFAISFLQGAAQLSDVFS